MSFIMNLPEEIHDLTLRARQITGEYGIFYEIDSGMTLEEYKKYLLERIAKAEKADATN